MLSLQLIFPLNSSGRSFLSYFFEGEACRISSFRTTGNSFSESLAVFSWGAGKSFSESLAICRHFVSNVSGEMSWFSCRKCAGRNCQFMILKSKRDFCCIACSSWSSPPTDRCLRYQQRHRASLKHNRMSFSLADVKPICFEFVGHYKNPCVDLGWWSDVCKEENVIQY